VHGDRALLTGDKMDGETTVAPLAGELTVMPEPDGVGAGALLLAVTVTRAVLEAPALSQATITMECCPTESETLVSIWLE
jgi:hypothetical protein